MSPPGDRVTGFPTTGIHNQLNTLTVRVGGVEHRMGAVEGHTAGLVKDVADIKRATDRFVDYEATVKSWLARGVLLILGSIGGTYGVTRITTPTPTPQRTEIIKSATTVKVEACTAMQAGPARDDCALKILTELMGPR